jgi:uncharacterized protein (TIGR03084 family)
MTIFEDLAAEQDRLENILAGLDETRWTSASGAAGWTVADVVLHLAQSEEAVTATVTRVGLRTGLGAVPGGTMDERAGEAVRRERSAPPEVFGRWQRARRQAASALRGADPQRPVEWVGGPVKPATLATTRLTEHWAHGLDITVPLGLGLPDTERLRHIAWLAHRMLPYALALDGEQPADVRCELTAPDGSDVWRCAGSSRRSPRSRLAAHTAAPPCACCGPTCAEVARPAGTEPLTSPRSSAPDSRRPGSETPGKGRAGV